VIVLRVWVESALSGSQSAARTRPCAPCWASKSHHSHIGPFVPGDSSHARGPRDNLEAIQVVQQEVERLQSHTRNRWYPPSMRNADLDRVNHPYSPTCRSAGGHVDGLDRVLLATLAAADLRGTPGSVSALSDGGTSPYVTPPEAEVLIAAPDRTTWLGHPTSHALRRSRHRLPAFELAMTTSAMSISAARGPALHRQRA
jgi:hypothetical protein